VSALFSPSCRVHRAALLDLVEGSLPVAAEEAALQHVAVCPSCSAELVDTVAVLMRLRRLAAADRGAVPPGGGWERLRARIVAHEQVHQQAPLATRLATLFAQGGLKAVIAPLVLLVALASSGAGAQLFGGMSPATVSDVGVPSAPQARLAPEDRAGAAQHGQIPEVMRGLRVALEPRAAEDAPSSPPIARF
jgi:hypothetical protein